MSDAPLEHLNGTTSHLRKRSLLERLFENAPKMEDASGPQAPALECQVVLKSGYQANGALSTTPEGPLRFLTMAQTPNGTVAIEIYFDIDDLESLAVIRGAVEQKSSLLVG